MDIIYRIVNRYDSLIWIRLLGEFLISTTRSMIAPFLILYLNEKVGSQAPVIMLIIGIQPLTEILVTLAAGGITDRFGRKPIMLTSLVMQVIAISAMALADSLLWFGLFYAVNGVGRSLFIPAERAQIADVVPKRQQAEVFALVSTIGSIGSTLGPVIGLLVYRYNQAFSFWSVAISLLIYACMIWLKVTETSPPIPTIPSIPSPKGSHSPAQKHGMFSICRLRNLLCSDRYVLGLMVFSLPISFFYAQTETNFQLHAKNMFSDYLSVLASLATLKGILSMVFEFWLIKRTERLPIGTLLGISYTAYMIAAIGYGFATSFPLLCCAGLALVIGESIGLTHLLKIVSAIAPATGRGRYFAIYGTHWDISRTAGPYIGSLLYLHFGGEVLFGSIAILLLIGGIAQIQMVRNVQKTFPQALEG